jgi:hypothetical protein
MNDYNLLKSMFEDFKVEDEEIPVEYLKYKGKSKTYVTYTFTDDRPSLFGDNKEIGSIVNIDIDIFSDGNFLAIEEKVKEVMEENNFIRTGCSPDMYEEDTGLYHKTIEFEKERMR